MFVSVRLTKGIRFSQFMLHFLAGENNSIELANKFPDKMSLPSVLAWSAKDPVMHENDNRYPD
jgi:hypothetical protein